MNQKGQKAEILAKEFLINNSFQIIDTNFFAKKLGELDIIAKKDGVYHFCEVKSGKTYEKAISNINKKKLDKIKKSCLYYLQKNNLDVEFCIDAIIVIEKEITLIENISI